MHSFLFNSRKNSSRTLSFSAISGKNVMHLVSMSAIAFIRDAWPNPDYAHRLVLRREHESVSILVAYFKTAYLCGYQLKKKIKACMENAYFLGVILLEQQEQKKKLKPLYARTFLWVLHHGQTLKTLFNIVEERFKFFFELWCQCCIMMFRKVNKQPGMQKL